MAEYTTEENQELIDNIKGPRYYRIILQGYGGESSYMGLTKEQYKFWNALTEDEGDSEVINYCTDEEYDGIEIDDAVDFLKVEGEDYRQPWHDSPTEVVHQYGGDFGNMSITIDEVDSTEYNAGHVRDVVNNEEMSVWCADNEIDHVMNCEQAEEPDYVFQFWSAEKGSFFDGIIETNGPLDLKKLKITTNEYWNGDDVVETIEYNGVEVDNSGGDTTGKGYSGHFWKNVGDDED
jgi:REP element-mobilizing transposase RayT